jgi:hypothetical protein
MKWDRKIKTKELKKQITWVLHHRNKLLVKEKDPLLCRGRWNLLSGSSQYLKLLRHARRSVSNSYPGDLNMWKWTGMRISDIFFSLSSNIFPYSLVGSAGYQWRLGENKGFGEEMKENFLWQKSPLLFEKITSFFLCKTATSSRMLAPGSVSLFQPQPIGGLLGWYLSLWYSWFNYFLHWDI